MGNYSSKSGTNGAPLSSSGKEASAGVPKSPVRRADNLTSDVAHASPTVDGSAAGNDDASRLVPTVFKWEHGGREVYITGTFNNWDRRIPMHRSGNDFSYVHDLKRGKHAFKFIVDDEWRFAPDQPTVQDSEGRVSNFIDVSEFQPYVGDERFFERSRERKIDDSEFGQEIPDEDGFTKEPLGLPPHLRHIILNKVPASSDPLALPVPQHVSLNHLYCTAIKDGIMVLGSTQRYKEKYQTTVFYSTMMG